MNQKQHKQSYGSAAIQDVILGIESLAYFIGLSSNHSRYPYVLSALSGPIAVKTLCNYRSKNTRRLVLGVPSHE
jgi:hypothetical protein